jgi:endo-alpha-1,4-polygalactosaminidase (GH114 family)
MNQIRDLLSHFDWALNEEWFQFDECETLLPFIEAGKPVFNVEYALKPSEFCDQALEYRFMSLKKNLDVDATRQAC